MVERSTVGCFLLAGALVVVGTLATGFLPPTLPYQVLAGGTIVAGFAVIVFCLREEPSSEQDAE